MIQRRTIQLRTTKCLNLAPYSGRIEVIEGAMHTFPPIGARAMSPVRATLRMDVWKSRFSRKLHADHRLITDLFLCQYQDVGRHMRFIRLPAMFIIGWLLLGSCVAFAQTLQPVEIQKLTASDGNFGDFFGVETSVQIDRAVVGASAAFSGGAGAAYVFLRHDNGTPLFPTDDVWLEEAKLTASDASDFDGFGFSVSIDADWIIVGAPGNNDAGNASGSAYVFRRDDNQTPADQDDDFWVEEAKLVASDAKEFAQFGGRVILSGAWAIIGAPEGALNGGSGATYVFRRDENGTPSDPSDDVWAEHAKLLASDGAVADFFGSSVCWNNDWIVIGAYADDDGGASSGAAYVFRHDDNSTPSDSSDDFWVEEAKLTAADADILDHFGWNVSCSGLRIVVSSENDSDSEQSSGSAYVFLREDNGTPLDTSDDHWLQEAKLTASDATPEDGFGQTVSINNGVVVVGAFSNDEAALDAGAVYVFRRNNNGTPLDPMDDTWIEETKLIPTNVGEGDWFGLGVVISNTWATLSAPTDISGSVYPNVA